MPEGPEVRIYTDWLRPRVGSQLVDVIVRAKSRYARHPDSSRSLAEFVGLEPKIDSVWCHGKHNALVSAAAGRVLVFSYGMTGGWSLNESSATRIEFTFKRGDQYEIVYFNDTRNFGTVTSHTIEEFADRKSCRCGIDVLELPEDLDDAGQEKLARRIMLHVEALIKKPTPIADVLLDQRIFAGVGNYLRSEILYQASLSPDADVTSLPYLPMLAVAQAWHQLAWRSYKLGGCSIKSYVQPNGRQGEFQRQLSVYGQKTDPFMAPVFKKKDSKGRTIWYVQR